MVGGWLGQVKPAKVKDSEGHCVVHCTVMVVVGEGRRMVRLRVG